MSSLHQVAEVLELQPQPQPSCQASVCSSVFVSSQQRCGGTDIKAPSAIPALGSWTDRVIALRSRRDCVLALRQISVTAQLGGVEGWGRGEPFGSSFCFFRPPGPALCKLGLVGSAVLPEVLTPVLRPSFDLSLFYFCGLFPSLSFSHYYFGLLFPILT